MTIPVSRATICALALLSLPLGTPPASRAAVSAYQRRWYTLAGGGAIPSSNAQTGYRLGGTIGQPTAGALTAVGGYRTRGGFWSGLTTTAVDDVPDKPISRPSRFRILTPYPNPSRGSSTISFELPQSCDVVARVLDLQGRWVRELDHSRREAGQQRLAWDGRDAAGMPVARGLYFIHIDAGRDRGVVKLLLLVNGGLR